MRSEMDMTFHSCEHILVERPSTFLFDVLIPRSKQHMNHISGTETVK